MIRKSLAFLMTVFVLFVGANAQTPAPGAQGETKSFSMFFDSDGSYLGVQTVEITKENFAKYGLRQVRGVAIEKVMEGSPAEKAGLQAGDVIVRFNDDEVTSVRKLTRVLGETAPDHQVRLTVIRAGSEREFTATLAKRPMPKFNEGGFTWSGPNPPTLPQGEFPTMPPMERLPRMENFPNIPDAPFVLGFGTSRRIGISVNALSKQLSEHFGVANGVMISEVRTDSPAAKAGLKAGDIIVDVDGKEVKGEGDLIRAIAEKKEGDVTLTIVRDRNRQTIRITPEEVKGGFDGRLLEFPRVTDGGFAPGSLKFSMPTIGFPTGGFKFPTSIRCVL